MKLWIDTETYSETPINRGTYRYAADAEMMIVTWAVNDGPVEVWDRTLDAEVPEALIRALTRCSEVWAHNAMFDRRILRSALGDNMVPQLHRWRCMMARAYAHSLPGSLDRLCKVFRVQADKAKLDAGKALVRLFCAPQKSRKKGVAPTRATRDTHPEKWQEFIEYATRDIESMRAIDGLMPAWNYGGPSEAAKAEVRIWHLDQRMNERGFRVDVELARAIQDMVEERRKYLRAEAHHNTAGVVTSTAQVLALRKFIEETFGYHVQDLRHSTIERLLADEEAPDAMKELLRNRVEMSSVSLEKTKTILNCHVNGALYGTQQYGGAARTLRWAGRLFQPHNIPSRGLLPKDQIPHVITSLYQRTLAVLWPEPMRAAVSALRGCIIARPSTRLVAADLSNIEGRGLAWLAGEQWKLDVFRAFDAGEGLDPYVRAYAEAFGIPPEMVTDFFRQIGKVMELALGYEGGVGAFATFAMAYGIDLEKLADDAYPGLAINEPDLLEEAEGFFDWVVQTRKPRFGLSRKAFVTCDVLKRAWRRAHQMTVALWADLKRGAIAAIQNPGERYTAGRLALYRSGTWLRMELPSGRCLCYPSARVEEDGRVSYMGMNQYTRRWERLHTYGGKLAENATQAFARDVLAHALPEIERSGYGIVLTVHDEVVAESVTLDDALMARIMSTPPPWAPDIPLAAKGFTADRYRK